MIRSVHLPEQLRYFNDVVLHVVLFCDTSRGVVNTELLFICR